VRALELHALFHVDPTPVSANLQDLVPKRTTRALQRNDGIRIDLNHLGDDLKSMNRIPTLVLAACCTVPAFAETNVGVSNGINQPGVCGRIDIGNYPQPAVVYARPIIIVAPPSTAVHVQPVYLYVPPEHQKNWAKHCGHYNACGQPVYFVQERWAQERYSEQQEHAHNDHPGSKEKNHNEGKGGN